MSSRRRRASGKANIHSTSESLPVLSQQDTSSPSALLFHVCFRSLPQVRPSNTGAQPRGESHSVAEGLSTRGGKLHNWWFQHFFPQALLATSVLSDAAFVSLDWLPESFKAIKRSGCWVESGCRMLSIAQVEVEMSTKRFWWRRRGGIVLCMCASDISNNLWEVTVI